MAGVWVERKTLPIQPLWAEVMWRQPPSWRLAEARTRPCPGQGPPGGHSGQLSGDAWRDARLMMGWSGRGSAAQASWVWAQGMLWGVGFDDRGAALQPHECLAQAGLCFGVALARLRSRGLRSLLPQPLPAAQRPPPGPSIPVPQILLLEIHSIKSEGLRATWRAEPVTQPHLRGWQDTRAASMEHHPGGWRGGAPGCGGPSRVPSRLEGRRRDSAGKLGFLRGAPYPGHARHKVAWQAGAVSRLSP